MNTKSTITEALAEIKLIGKKIVQKQEIIKQNLTRAKHVADIYESQGGSVEYLKKEMQSVNDLQQRLVNIRSAIITANSKTTLTVEGQTMTVNEWLIWKREIKENQNLFLKVVAQELAKTKASIEMRPAVYKDDKDQTKLVEMVYNLDHAELNKASQLVSSIAESLDGKLSLINATTIIEY